MGFCGGATGLWFSSFLISSITCLLRLKMSRLFVEGSFTFLVAGGSAPKAFLSGFAFGWIVVAEALLALKGVVLDCFLPELLGVDSGLSEEGGTAITGAGPETGIL